MRSPSGSWPEGVREGRPLLRHPADVGLALSVLACFLGTSRGDASECANALASTADIQSAMLNAQPGATLFVAPGVYVGVRSRSGDPSGKGQFYSGRNGTAASPIVLASCDPGRPAVLMGGGVGDGSYVLHLTGDHWVIRDLVVTEGTKGIVIDNGNHNVLRGVEVHTIGDEGVHVRDGSSYNVLEQMRIHDTGKVRPGYGEGIYVGSDSSAAYDHDVVGNVIRFTAFTGNITAEPVDIKEGANGTLVEYCTFDGTGISGEHYADSFVDVKGVNSVVRYNQGFRDGNAKVLDAFQVHAMPGVYPSGQNNTFNGNTVDLGGAAGYVVRASSGTLGTRASEDVRIDGGNLYNSRVNVPLIGLEDGSGRSKLALGGFRPNPCRQPEGIAFTLASAATARLEVLDLAGRLVFAEQVGALGAGRHVLRSAALSRLAPGHYLLSLSQSGERRTARGVIVR